MLAYVGSHALVAAECYHWHGASALLGFAVTLKGSSSFTRTCMRVTAPHTHAHTRRMTRTSEFGIKYLSHTKSCPQDLFRRISQKKTRHFLCWHSVTFISVDLNSHGGLQPPPPPRFGQSVLYVAGEKILDPQIHTGLASATQGG